MGQLVAEDQHGNEQGDQEHHSDAAGGKQVHRLKVVRGQKCQQAADGDEAIEDESGSG